MLRGQTMPAGQRAVIAEALRGNRHGEANRGSVRTPEARQRMSAARRAGSEARQPVSYSAVHKRLRKDRGTPSLCEHCGTTTAKKFEWAYTGDGHEHGAFGADLSQYIRLCASCHLKYDGQHARSWSSRKEVIALCQSPPRATPPASRSSSPSISRA